MFNLIQGVQGVQDETKKKIIEMLEKLAGTAGQAAEHLWTAACRAIFARGLAGVIGYTLAIIMVITVWTLLNKRVAKFYEVEVDNRMITFIITSLVSMAIIGMMISGIVTDLSSVIAPEGEAIFKILGK